MPLQIVFIHGITGSRRFFAGLEDRLRSAPTAAATLSFDLPGFGDNQNMKSNYDRHDALRFITQSIQERFPAGELALVGHSLGGVLALAWALEHLPRINRLVLLNTPLGEDRDDIIRSLLRERTSWATVFLKHRHVAHLTCVVLRWAHLIRAFHFMKPPYVPEAVFQDYDRHNWSSMSHTFDRLLLGLPGRPLIRRITSIPVLNLTGSEDDELSRRTVEQPNVGNVTLPGGHLMLLEHPGPTAAVIERFLSQ